MDDIDKMIISLEDKENATFEEMDKLIDSIDNVIQETNNELSLDNNKDDSKTKDILTKKEGELRKLKTIPKVNRICN